MTREEPPEMTESEPTVLDWVKSLLRLKPIPIPEPSELPELLDEIEVEEKPSAINEVLQDDLSFPMISEGSEYELERSIKPNGFRITVKHLRLPVAILLALFAQFVLESKPRNVVPFVAIYIIAGLFAGWGAWAGDFSLVVPEDTQDEKEPSRVKLSYLAAGAVLTLLTYFVSRLNEFNPLNLFLWVSALTCFLIAFWEGEPPYIRVWNWMQALWRSRDLNIHIRPWHLLVTASIVLIVYFRFTQLDRVPYEMWSDHAEKLWDVMDVLEGRYSIFFPRNTGREGMQIYMAAATAKYLGTGISFATLKIGTILAGLLTLPYLYLFAKEYGDRYLGLATVLLAGIAYWPNAISRVGLRFPLYPLFVAPAMYYLLRGIRIRQRNDFLLCGFAVGLGLHGYSPARVIPLAVVIGVLIFIISRNSEGRRLEVSSWLLLAGVIALVVFIPLLGAVTDMMDIYLGRMVSRIGPTEQPLPGPPLVLFMENLWRGLWMFAWDNGRIWVSSIPFRPALDWVTGAFFHLGVVIVLVRFLRQRRWQDLFLLLLIPILMLPSIMSLAFPDENPALSRASGAIIPVFTLAAIPIILFLRWAWESFKSRIAHTSALVVILLCFLIAARSNYRLVLDEFADLLRLSLLNTSEIGAVIRGFADTIGSYDTAHVIPFPYWVDTRLVGINAGDPMKDYGVWPQDLDKIPPEPDRPQLFIFKPEDADALESLRELYPNGVLKLGDSEVPGRDFMLYYVFPGESIELDTAIPEKNQ